MAPPAPDDNVELAAEEDAGELLIDDEGVGSSVTPDEVLAADVGELLAGSVPLGAAEGLVPGALNPSSVAALGIKCSAFCII